MKTRKSPVVTRTAVGEIKITSVYCEFILVITADCVGQNSLTQEEELHLFAIIHYENTGYKSPFNCSTSTPSVSKLQYNRMCLKRTNSMDLKALKKTEKQQNRDFSVLC